ncbi:response regulator [Hydrogenophaga sp. 5NK40-0174]|uniref:response regulator n=1 Tax=Hydrogenophaga sp. 5NK40-0174 TaxID=3127649 RepID=UPI00310523C7
MALTIPLFHRPGSILFLDDDQDYLEMLGMVLPPSWQVELYSRPSAFMERMKDEPARWEADAGHQLMILERWRQGHALLPLILRYWATNPSRYQLAETCVVDYAMPGTDGLKVLNSLLDWPGSRVLLTGQADEQIAIQAFNNGLIDQFVPKQSADITRQIMSVIAKLAHTPHPRLNTLWRSVLQPGQQSVLQVPSVARDLLAFVQKHWVEYVFIGEPFGALGVDNEGDVYWLQLETTASLGDLAELTSSAGASLETVKAVEQGKQLVAAEMQQQLSLRGALRSAQAFGIGDDRLLTAAVFPLAPEDLPLPIYAFKNFLSAQGSRGILDS